MLCAAEFGDRLARGFQVPRLVAPRVLASPVALMDCSLETGGISPSGPVAILVLTGGGRGFPVGTGGSRRWVDGRAERLGAWWRESLLESLGESLRESLMGYVTDGGLEPEPGASIKAAQPDVNGVVALIYGEFRRI